MCEQSVHTTKKGGKDMQTKFMIPIEVKNQTLFDRKAQKKNLYQIAGTVCQHFCSME